MVTMMMIIYIVVAEEDELDRQRESWSIRSVIGLFLSIRRERAWAGSFHWSRAAHGSLFKTAVRSTGETTGLIETVMVTIEKQGGKLLIRTCLMLMPCEEMKFVLYHICWDLGDYENGAYCPPFPFPATIICTSS